MRTRYVLVLPCTSLSLSLSHFTLLPHNLGCIVDLPVIDPQSLHHHSLMTDRYRQLLEVRASARAVLDVSAAWVAWKAADAAAQSTLEVDDLERQSVRCPTLVPEEVVDLTDSFAPWDEQDPVLLEYMRVRRVEELREQLMNSVEWRSFHAAQERLLDFAKEELTKKKQALEVRRRTSRSLANSEDAQHRSSLPPSSSLTAQLVAAAEGAISVASLDPSGVSPTMVHMPLGTEVTAMSISAVPEQVLGGGDSPPAPMSQDTDTTSIVGFSVSINACGRRLGCRGMRYVRRSSSTGCTGEGGITRPKSCVTHFTCQLQRHYSVVDHPGGQGEWHFFHASDHTRPAIWSKVESATPTHCSTIVPWQTEDAVVVPRDSGRWQCGAARQSAGSRRSGRAQDVRQRTSSGAADMVCARSSQLARCAGDRPTVHAR